MNPIQFNASGMMDLLNDQQREISAQVTRMDRRFNRENLTDMGDDIAARSVSSDQRNAPMPAATQPQAPAGISDIPSTSTGAVKPAAPSARKPSVSNW